MTDMETRRCGDSFAAWGYLPNCRNHTSSLFKNSYLRRYIKHKAAFEPSTERWSKPKKAKAASAPEFVKQEVVTISPENAAAIRLLQSWRNEDEQEQRETWDYLRRVLDEDRLSDRKFFS